ncbi:hypothetical protein Tsubulata_008924 [Turnera subulata]|uniref:non-specific serine/threonine protein kinase n=1 Tax=Turnera subulata TaxID=218843 RepID=A0A9Q0IYW6_9ROSI|nr:hypothetical protein Tsubulata_008924 [Turnera subulata]
MHPVTTTTAAAAAAASAATFYLLILLTLFTHPTTSFSSYDVALPNCNQTFSCGSLENITYPFTGGPRPSYCGPPGFHLTCNDDDSVTFQPANSPSYRVTELNQTAMCMTLARSDLYDDACAHQFTNTTLDHHVFALGDHETLSLFYGCKCNDTVACSRRPPDNLFSCDAHGFSGGDAYFWLEPVPRDPVLDFFQCKFSVTVPVVVDWEHQPKTIRSLVELLRDGFNVVYKNPYSDDCELCVQSGGQCGFDAELGKPICICDDHLCPAQKPGSKSKVSVGIGVGIAGAVVAALFLGVFAIRIMRRRKRTFDQMQSKDIPATDPPSSKSLTTPSTNLSQSIPSYPSSKSDLGRGSTYFGVQVFNYEELEEATDGFNPSKELGDGGFGTVYYGILKDGRAVAVKRLYENNVKRAEQFMNEVEILARLRHKNLVTLYGCTSKRSRDLLLVYEYIPNGTVADHLHGKESNSGLLPWPVRLSIAIETADALAYLHDSEIIHRDVKTNNILLDNSFRVKVADFGLSRLFPTAVTHVSTAPQGTPGYVDPEYYQCYQLTDKSDVYSFGVVLIELISSLQAVDTNRKRHDINLGTMAINKIQNHELHQLVDPSLGFEKDSAVRKMVISVAELAFRCLQQERDMRPTMAEVLEALRRIQNENYGRGDVVVVDVREDDVGLLKHPPPLLEFSPDSSGARQCTY